MLLQHVFGPKSDKFISWIHAILLTGLISIIMLQTFLWKRSSGRKQGENKWTPASRNRHDLCDMKSHMNKTIQMDIKELGSKTIFCDRMDVESRVWSWRNLIYGYAKGNVKIRFRSRWKWWFTFVERNSTIKAAHSTWLEMNHDCETSSSEQCCSSQMRSCYALSFKTYKEKWPRGNQLQRITAALYKQFSITHSGHTLDKVI